MLGTFIDKVNGLLDRQFLIVYWFPVFIASIIAILIRVYVYGFSAALTWWQQDWMLKGQEEGFYAHIWFIVGILISITILAFLLQPFTPSMIKFYEGYWPFCFQERLTNLFFLGEKSVWKKKNYHLCRAQRDEDWNKYNSLKAQLFYRYPPIETLIMPTKLGNTLEQQNTIIL